MSTQSYLLMVGNAVPAKSVAELVAHARANPGKLNYGSVGNGSQIHLLTELFRTMTRTEVTHVPYKGITNAYPDLISGNIQPDVAARLAAEGSEAVGSTPQQLAAHIKAERARWANVIKDAGIKGEE